MPDLSDVKKAALRHLLNQVLRQRESQEKHFIAVGSPEHTMLALIEILTESDEVLTELLEGKIRFKGVV